jgi:hypothetical protein
LDEAEEFVVFFEKCPINPPNEKPPIRPASEKHNRV